MNPYYVQAGVQAFGAYVDAQYQNELVDIQNGLARTQAVADSTTLLANNTVAASATSFALSQKGLANRRNAAVGSDAVVAAVTAAARQDAALQASSFEAAIAASEAAGAAAATGTGSSLADAVATATALRASRQRQYMTAQRADVADDANRTAARLVWQLAASQDLGFAATGLDFRKPTAAYQTGVSPWWAAIKAAAGPTAKGVSQ